MFDPDRAVAHAAAMQHAAAIIGRVCSAEEEQAASEAFMRWAQSIGLRATFERTVGDDGRLVWSLLLDAGRGRYEATTTDPRRWRDAVRELGLPLDTISDDWTISDDRTV